MMANNTLILGIGNTLLGDEAVGVKTVGTLRANHPELSDVEFLDGGTLSFTLAGPIEEAENLIVIDAAQLNRAPGSVQVFEGPEMDRFITSSNKTSVHEVNLVDLLAIAHLSDRLPQRRALIGIQPERIDWSDTLTEAVAEAVPVACDLAVTLLQRWRG